MSSFIHELEQTGGPGLAITALITAAVHDESPTRSLDEIYEALASDSAKLWEYLDPLNILSPLLASPSGSATKIVALMCRKCSPKELILAADEVLENLCHASSLNMDDEAEAETEKRLKRHEQVVRLAWIYRDSIPRVPFRKKSPGATVKSFLSNLRRTIALESHNFNKDTGRQALHSAQELAREILQWAEGKSGVTADEVTETKVKIGAERNSRVELISFQDILRVFLESIVDSLAHCVDASLAARAFELVFPRLSRKREPTKNDWKEGAEIMSSFITLYTTVNGSWPYTLPPTPSRSSLILYSHWQIERPSTENPEKVLSFFLPAILATIQFNDHVIDSTLSTLLSTLCSLCSSHIYLSPDLIIPLSTVLPSLCVAHPDPDIRHYTFRSLALLLKAAEPPLRFQVLRDLAQDKQQGHGKMRVASVSLIKEAMIEALDHENDESLGMFASPQFLKGFGNIMFTPDPQDFFTRTNEEMTEEMEEELERLTECLGLYYVLIVRDKKNRTGIRDKDNLANVERGLLKPMRHWLRIHIEKFSAVKEEDVHAVMPLVALNISLERIDEQLRIL
ncbi:hypothetical protein Moror_16628 [Moniliophthora roreri MCA 2997]|uniref:Uncharacterized protein n=1 Tax=Moniliophthora roreri (strain MCA 2997) TaxID=1381753 RepID=V2WHD0_MONRO|nr:hypothetical protein Moror_16628 [Moniliophthora roreri MCA 2997]